MADYYDELLKLCGFEDEEIEKERPRIEKSFERLGIGPGDMETADTWVRQNHDVTLKGVRKLLGAWLKELIDLVLARDEGKKIVYYGFPAILGPGLILSASSKDVMVTAPDMVLDHTMGQIFNKLIPILETGEANGLPPGHALCSLWQAKIGGIALGMIPVPDLALASSYYCDMGSKADDLVTALYGVPVAYIDGVMDSPWGEFPEYLPERVHYLGAQINQALKKAEEVLGIEIVTDAWERSQKESRLYRDNLVRLVELMKADPVPISIAELELMETISSSSTGRGIREGIKAMDILIREMEIRVKEGIGVSEKGAPRVMLRAGHTSDPRITHLAEKTGLAVPLTFILGTLGGVRVNPKGNYNTPGEIIADYEMSGGYYHGTEAQIQFYEKAAALMKLDGFIATYIYNCRPVATISHPQKKYLEEKTGLPVLSLEIDNFDSRAYSADSLRTKVETFAEMLKAKKAAKT
ncbi:MAG: 2-hydroxyacyl-CoA dehydratase [Deltaproteobacteria bacterium]|nr:2-hydroxyacyl-CoA dehydratase [Deltaproteobacteria bacterium]